MENVAVIRYHDIDNALALRMTDTVVALRVTLYADVLALPLESVPCLLVVCLPLELQTVRNTMYTIVDKECKWLASQAHVIVQGFILPA